MPPIRRAPKPPSPGAIAPTKVDTGTVDEAPGKPPARDTSVSGFVAGTVVSTSDVTPRTEAGQRTKALLESKGSYLGGEAKADLIRSMDLVAPDRQPLFLAHLEVMLGSRRPWHDLTQRFDIAARTGYLLTDTAGGDVARTWTSTEVAAMGRVLDALPPALRFLPGLTTIERRGPSAQPGLLGEYFDEGNIVLYDVKFGGAGTPTRLFFDVATHLSGNLPLQQVALHELGHALESSNPQLSARWGEHYALHGAVPQAGGPNSHEAFAQAFWLFAASPSTLERWSPGTHAFMRAEFGDALRQLSQPAVTLVLDAHPGFASYGLPG